MSSDDRDGVVEVEVGDDFTAERVDEETEGKGLAVVTGASRGIGYELARLFAATGHDVALVARSEEDLRAAADRFEERYGVDAGVVVADLSEPEAPRRVYEACEDHRVTALVNNAGFGTNGPFAESDRAVELDQVQVNVAAVTDLTRLFVEEMVDRGEGKVLNVASLAAFQPGPLMSVYYASKAYVLHFSEALHEETPDGVTVTALCPGPVDTDFHERAGTEGSALDSLVQKDARTVARAGYRGLTEERAVVVPGLVPKLLAQSLRVTPRVLARKVARLVNTSASD
jgi:short-subunit dehydrogenase